MFKKEILSWTKPLRLQVELQKLVIAYIRSEHPRFRALTDDLLYWMLGSFYYYELVEGTNQFMGVHGYLLTSCSRTSAF
jgi:hypothetical protein